MAEDERMTGLKPAKDVLASLVDSLNTEKEMEGWIRVCRSIGRARLAKRDFEGFAPEIREERAIGLVEIF